MNHFVLGMLIGISVGEIYWRFYKAAREKELEQALIRLQGITNRLKDMIEE